ncbi:hypothetical protein R3P38DRAFT_597490 [Favolaschia claudopus]|uniref:CCHC-type domain-containing protein n=1 Tax=Favolaschia claudopus TaxID=2862362 RepID=A0AAV9Z8P2_9AGAR
MSSFEGPVLSDTEEAAIRTLHKSVKATSYEDAADQDEFLIASANTILQFKNQIRSFALTPEVGQCVFVIRTKLQANNSRLKTPPNADILKSLTDFAGEISRLRQLIQDRNRATTARVRAEEGVAARAERREALQSVARNQRPNKTRDTDVVSIPSDSDNDIHPGHSPIVVEPPSSPAKSENTVVGSPTQVCSTGLLSPLDEIQTLMLSMGLTDSPAAPPISPLSRPRSLPVLEPSHPRFPRILASALGQIQVPPNRHHSSHGLVARCGSHKMAATYIAGSPISPGFNAAVPVLHSYSAIPRFHRPNLSFGSGWSSSKPKSIGSSSRRNKLHGRSKQFKPLPGFFPNPKVLRASPRSKAAKIKRCWFCSSPGHFIATCPAREVD